MFPLGSWLLSTGQHTAVCNPHGTDFCKSHEVGVQFHFVSQIDSQHHLLKRLQLLIFLLIWNVAFASFKCICVHLHIHHSNVYVCAYVYIKYFPKSSYFHNNLLKIIYTNEWICLWGLRFVPLLYLSTSIPLLNCLQVHSKLWYPIEQASPTVLLKSVWANLSPLHFFIPFSISLSVSAKTNKNINKYPWDSYWDYIESIGQPEENWSLQYWVVQAVNMVYFSTYLDPLEFF